jgi:hypothetical protein
MRRNCSRQGLDWWRQFKLEPGKIKLIPSVDLETAGDSRTGSGDEAKSTAARVASDYPA